MAATPGSEIAVNVGFAVKRYPVALNNESSNNAATSQYHHLIELRPRLICVPLFPVLPVLPVFPLFPLFPLSDDAFEGEDEPMGPAVSVVGEPTDVGDESGDGDPAGESDGVGAGVPDGGGVGVARAVGADDVVGLVVCAG